MVGSKQLGHSQDMQCLCKAREAPAFGNLHQVCVGNSEPKTTHSNDQVINGGPRKELLADAIPFCCYYYFYC